MDKYMDKYYVAPPHNGILLSLQKKGTPDDA
jgi:hypothetical protein